MATTTIKTTPAGQRNPKPEFSSKPASTVVPSMKIDILQAGRYTPGANK